jgi:hypothetical protein
MSKEQFEALLEYIDALVDDKLQDHINDAHENCLPRWPSNPSPWTIRLESESKLRKVFGCPE